ILIANNSLVTDSFYFVVKEIFNGKDRGSR
ncbi:unnamed protein product, partial [marine sediment metagenome]